MNGSKAKVLMLRSYYPDARAGKLYQTISERYDAYLHSWCRGKQGCENRDKLSLFRFPLDRQSPLVVFILPLFQLSIILRIIRLRPKIVHAADFDTMLPAFLICRIMGIKTVYDIYDYYSDMISSDSIGRYVSRMIARIDRVFIKNADRVIIVDDNQWEQIEDLEENVVVVYNSPESDKINPSPSYNEEFTIFFGGFVSRERGISALCEVVSQLPAVKLLICGATDKGYKNELLEKYSRFSNIVFDLQYIDHKEILDKTKSAQLIPVLYDNSVTNNWYSSPCKFFEALAFGIPVLTYRGCSVDLKVEDHQCGMVVEQDDLLGMKKAIESLYGHREEWKKMSEHGMDASHSTYSWNIMRDRLFQLYDSLLHD